MKAVEARFGGFSTGFRAEQEGEKAVDVWGELPDDLGSRRGLVKARPGVLLQLETEGK